MKEPKFGRWTHVNDRLPGRDEKVLAADPITGEQVIVTGGEVAARAELLLWMPLLSHSAIGSWFDALTSEA
jgi:hypothetical protein